MGEAEIKWLPLRLNIIPLLDKQTQKVLALYQATHQEIIGGDILSIQKLIAIKKEITQRIKQIDAFYARNAVDPRAKHLYGIRSILAKVAEQQNQFEKINEFDMSQQSNWDIGNTPNKEQPQDQVAVISTTKRRQPSQHPTPSQNNYKMYEHTPQSKNVTARTPYSHHQDHSRPIYTSQVEREKVVRLSDIKKSPLKSKSPINIREQKPQNMEKGSSRKIQQALSKRGGAKKIEQVMQLQRERNQMSSKLEHSAFDIKKSFKDLSELVFTIKMTKEEYNEFMRLKKKNNHA